MLVCDELRTEDIETVRGNKVALGHKKLLKLGLGDFCCYGHCRLIYWGVFLDTSLGMD